MAPGAAPFAFAFGVTGAAVGDPVVFSFSQPLQGCYLTGEVSAADAVSGFFINPPNNPNGTIDLTTGDLTAMVFKV